MSFQPGNKCGLKHGHCNSRTHIKWRSMKYRVSHKNKRGRADYFDRGIVVCDRWQAFENFLADMGECPAGMELDRIDNNGNYEPGNCRWVARQVNQMNRRVSKWITHNGTTLPVTEWAQRLGLHYQTIITRLRKWPIELALAPRFAFRKGGSHAV